MDKIKGVNLGNWLVLEKWMHPDLFFGGDYEDEYDIAHLLPDEEKKLRLKLHRDSYITERDFSLIASRGINVVRIPVPFFVFGDREPYVGCIEYLDKAFDWAQKFGMTVLIDLHTVPDSQNGFDNGGTSGVCKWHLKQENIDFTVDLLGRLTQRYAQHPALYGVELLNEPASDMVWNMSKQRYPARDAQYAEGSCGVPDDVLKQFYRDGYKEIRRYTDKPVVFHDGFRDAGWGEFFSSGEFENVVLDTHLYLSFAGFAIKEGERTAESFINLLDKMYEMTVGKYDGKVPVVIGEWCVSCPIDGLDGFDDEKKRQTYRALADAQLKKFESCAGWFYWSYKLIADMPGWDMEKCMELGWMPERV